MNKVFKILIRISGKKRLIIELKTLIDLVANWTELGRIRIMDARTEESIQQSEMAGNRKKWILF